MALDAGIAKRSILVAPEGEDGFVHPLGVEHLEPNKQVEVRDIVNMSDIATPRRFVRIRVSQ